MTGLIHEQFLVERLLPGSPAHGFRFFADRDLKRRWTSCHPDWHEIESGFDFRPGGSELSLLQAPDGRVHEYRAHYLDIARARHIIYAFTMRIDARLVSSSHATVELHPAPGGTRMLYTEQAAFTDAADVALRREGTGWGFDRLLVAVEADLATLQ